jgi:NAD(P)-dependent dehydrogenase (short-subunit alcohol dehydrogenase family)
MATNSSTALITGGTSGIGRAAALAQLMAKRGKGAIVNLSTMVSDYGAVGMSLYGSSKAAINLLPKRGRLNMAQAESASTQ